MAFSIKNPETDRLARRLAKATGESLTDAVTVAVRERLDRIEPRHRKRPSLAAELKAIAHEIARLPDVDPRPMDELLGYDEDGLPTKW